MENDLTQDYSAMFAVLNETMEEIDEIHAEIKAKTNETLAQQKLFDLETERAEHRSLFWDELNEMH